MTTSTTIASKLSDLLGCQTTTITVDGEDYVVTLDTGEVAFGRDLGGGCAFAYYAEEVSDWLVRWEDGTDGRSDGDQGAPYNAFCEDVNPVSDRAVALALAAAGHRLTVAGACNPVLTDDEFRDARDGLSETYAVWGERAARDPRLTNADGGDHVAARMAREFGEFDCGVGERWAVIVGGIDEHALDTDPAVIGYHRLTAIEARSL